MKTTTFVRIAAACAALFVAGQVHSATKEELEAALSHDGLQRVKVKDVDVAYTRPGASLKGYNKVMLDPVEVQFSKSWDPNKTGSMFKVSASEREEIRKGVGEIVREEFERQLKAKDGYAVVTAPGPDVLRAKASIVNLYVNAPDTGGGAGRSRTYTASAGEMTLYLELYDSESGQILARVVDRRESRSVAPMMIANRVTNTGEAHDIAATWARILRKAMDNAKAGAK
jgi:hypothetical protein